MKRYMQREKLFRSPVASTLLKPENGYTKCGFIIRVTILSGLPGTTSVFSCCPRLMINLLLSFSKVSELEKKSYVYSICNLVSKVLVLCQYSII